MGGGSSGRRDEPHQADETRRATSNGRRDEGSSGRRDEGSSGRRDEGSSGSRDEPHQPQTFPLHAAHAVAHLIPSVMCQSQRVQE
jgi:hypothetical protein